MSCVGDAFKPKPLVAAELMTEFGGVEDTEELRADGPFRKDYTFVPGFSDMRYQRDCDLSKLHRGEIRGSEVRTLSHNLRWYRATMGKGADPDNTRVVAAVSEGYRPVTIKDRGKEWFKDLPPRSIEMPDGTIKSAGGDLTLFVCDRDVAAKNAMRKKIKTEESVQGMEFEKGGLGTVKIKGADPYVERTIGTQPREANQ